MKYRMQAKGCQYTLRKFIILSVLSIDMRDIHVTCLKQLMNMHYNATLLQLHLLILNYMLIFFALVLIRVININYVGPQCSDQNT